MNIKRLIILAIALISVQMVSIAQLSVSITGTFSGCPPLIQQFGCTVSGASGDVTYSWSSGNGDVSQLTNPTFSYINSGRYTLSVTVTSGGQTATDSHEIVVFRIPTAHFADSPITGCIPYDFIAANQSTQGDAEITNYRWYFGDGQSSNEASPSHTYQSSGVYTVSLEVTDANECVNHYEAPQMITLSKAPTASFTAHDAQWCVAPHNVSFTSEISTTGGLGGSCTTHWNFGDGGSSTQENPSHTYTRTGTFDVSLTVADQYGCSTTVNQPEIVIIGMISPECTVPTQMCVNQTSLFTSNVDSESVWDFGDNTPSQPGPNTTHSYSQPGTYPVTFTVDPNGDCRQTRTFTIVVPRVEASFRTVPTNLFSCTYPFEVQFISTSEGDNLSYFYNFGDMRPGNEANMTHSYLQNGEYTPTLTVTSGNCSSQFTGPTIIVHEPIVSISASEDGGCHPLVVELTNGGPDNDIITDYFWEYGDGTSEHTTTPTTEHTYGLGTFVPTLTVTDQNNCTATREGPEISTGYQILPEYFSAMDSLHNEIPKGIVCASDTIILYNEMYEDHDTLDYTFIIVMNENPYEESSQETYHQYSFENDTGWAYIGLRVDYNQCKSDTLWWDSVYVVPPIVKIRSISDCLSPLDYTYKISKNVGADYWDWIITDLETETVVQQVLHSTVDSIDITYPSYGRYECKIVAYNNQYNQCEYEDKVTSEIVEPVMSWSISADTICTGRGITINIAEAAAYNEVAYNWTGASVSYDDLDWVSVSPGMQSEQHQYADSGSYNLTVYARQSDGCVSIFTKNIYVVGARAHMVPESLATGCVPATFEFEAIPETYDPLQYVIWDYGDGSPKDTTYTPYVPKEHTYTNTGTYTIKMTISTEHNCRFIRTYSNRIRVIDALNANVTFDARNICFGEESSFSSAGADNSVWHEWDFGDGTQISGNQSAVTHIYEQAGSYSITHIVSGGENGSMSCNDTARYENAMAVESVSADFELDSTFFSCYPISPTIQSNVEFYPDNINVEYTWDMGNNEQGIHVPNPQYLYTTPGIYDISLNVVTPAGCSSSATHRIEITGPVADIGLSDTIICAGGIISMSMINASNVDSMVWVVGGGYNYYTPEVTHQYAYVPESGYFPVTLSIHQGNCKIDLTERIFVYRLRGDFTLADRSGNTIEYDEGVCSPLIGNLNHEYPDDCTFQWIINGNQQTVENVNWQNNSLQVDSLFTVKLIATDTLGCTDSVSHQYYVYHMPTLRVSNDTTICYGDTVNMSAMDAYSYYWDTPIDDSLPNQSVIPEETTVYHVEAYTEHRCSIADSITVIVIPTYEVSLSDEYFKINMGDTAMALITYDNNAIECYITPEENLTMSGCDTIVFFPDESTDYVLVMKDTTFCPDHKFDIHIDVEKIFTLDVPGAFTPLSENDGNNIVYARGLGIKQLLQFRIYNRWGEEVFFTDDLHTGWDGTVNGKVQNSDTYSYYVEAEMFDGSVQSKKGNIMLIR
ncbi:MAG: PKD domain-containing protein [Bacteroidales bacterium]|nr:PKD domain-containing protein [Bacteroidales bacterium]